MQYKEVSSREIAACKKLYEEAEWLNYLKDEAAFKQMFDNALYTLGAYDQDQLVGLVRMIGDNAHILYIQDILVLKAYRRRGIGRTLLKEAMDKFSHVRQTVLITDDKDDTRGFYEACGLKKSSDMKIACFVKFR